MRTHPNVIWMVALVAGCGAPTLPDENLGMVDRATTSDNGETFNGVSFNGVSLNGTSVNGTSVNGTSVNGTTLNGTELSGIRMDGVPLTGKGMTGVVFNAWLEDGTPLALRIDDVVGKGNSTLYAVSYLSGGNWYPICGTDGSGAPVLAVPTGGVWDRATGKHKKDDPTLFTFSCEKATIGKCIDLLGYDPSATVSVNGNPVSLAPFLDACVRMIRADYCGTGESWTVNGRTIDIWDNIGVQSPSSTWTFEAEWTPDGARCVSTTRVSWSQRGSAACIPTLNAQVPDCGNPAHFGSGALLMNRFQTRLYQ